MNSDVLSLPRQQQLLLAGYKCMYTASILRFTSPSYNDIFAMCIKPFQCTIIKL